MASLTQKTFIVVAISFFLTTIPSNAFDYTLKESISPSSKGVPQVASNENVPSFVKSNMVGTMAKTKEFINVLEKKMSTNAPLDPYTKDCLKTCKEVYEDAIDSMEKATEDVKVENYYKANVDLSAMSTFFETCHDCVNDTKDHVINDMAFQKFENWARGIAKDCLDKVYKEYFKN